MADELHETDTTIVVFKDSKLGWAKSLKELIRLLYSGQIPSWDLSSTSCWCHSKLLVVEHRVKNTRSTISFRYKYIQERTGRKLTSLECHDLVCKIAEIVVVGGVRRSALISLSNLSDDRMRVAKSGQWWEDNGQKAPQTTQRVTQAEIGIFMDDGSHSTTQSQAKEESLIVNL